MVLLITTTNNELERSSLPRPIGETPRACDSGNEQQGIICNALILLILTLDFI